jgi:hypothetical protein
MLTMKKREIMRFVPDREALVREFLKSPEFLIDTFRKEPRLIDWVFRDAKQQRKYVKMPLEVEYKLKEIADRLGISNGLLIGIGILLLVSTLKEKV